MKKALKTLFGPKPQKSLKKKLSNAVFGSLFVTACIAAPLVTHEATMHFVNPPTSDVVEAQDPARVKIERLNVKFECSHTGLPEGEIPASSLIERNGKIKRVTFDEGWAVFNNELPGTLISVCRR